MMTMKQKEKASVQLAKKLNNMGISADCSTEKTILKNGTTLFFPIEVRLEKNKIFIELLFDEKNFVFLLNEEGGIVEALEADTKTEVYMKVVRHLTLLGF